MCCHSNCTVDGKVREVARADMCLRLLAASEAIATHVFTMGPRWAEVTVTTTGNVRTIKSEEKVDRK